MMNKRSTWATDVPVCKRLKNEKDELDAFKSLITAKTTSSSEASCNEKESASAISNASQSPSNEQNPSSWTELTSERRLQSILKVQCESTVNQQSSGCIIPKWNWQTQTQDKWFTIPSGQLNSACASRKKINSCSRKREGKKGLSEEVSVTQEKNKTRGAKHPRTVTKIVRPVALVPSCDTVHKPRLEPTVHNQAKHQTFFSLSSEEKGLLISGLKTVVPETRHSDILARLLTIVKSCEAINNDSVAFHRDSDLDKPANVPQVSRGNSEFHQNSDVDKPAHIPQVSSAMDPIQPSTSIGLMKFCQLCSISLYSIDELTSHYESDEHRQNLQRSLEILPKLTEEIKICPVCTVPLFTLDDVTIHYESDNHREKLHPVQSSSQQTCTPMAKKISKTTVCSVPLEPLLLVETEVSNEPKFTCRSIYSISKLERLLQRCNEHAHRCCVSRFKFQERSKHGLASQFVFKCGACQNVINNEVNEMDINTLAVFGSVSIGIGYSQLKELLTVMDIPCLSSQNYYHLSKFIHKEIKTFVKQQLTRQAVMVKQQAEALGHFEIENGKKVFWTSVVADGSWPKRSYGHNLSSLSGMAAVFDARTGAILDLDVRNCYCIICKRSKSKNTEPPIHECNKNWDQSAAKMESDIIVKFFEESELKYNLRYKYFIGDGDSSTYATILKSSRIQYTVTKIECTNHLLRNFRKHLKELSDNKGQLFERAEISLLKAENRLNRLNSTIYGVINYHHNSKDVKEVKVSQLREDFTNAPQHIFGNHYFCQPYFCNKKTDECNHAQHLTGSTMMKRIMEIIGKLIEHAEDLIERKTNNHAEQFMSLVSKMIGGKRINFCKGVQYETRCYAAACNRIFGPGWQMEAFQGMFPSWPPNEAIKKFAAVRRNHNNLDRNRRKLAAGKPSRNISDGDGAADYGPLCQQPDMNLEQFNIMKEKILHDMKVATCAERNDIEKKTHRDTHAANWKCQKKRRLTASNFGRVCKMQPLASCKKNLRFILYGSHLLPVIQNKINLEPEAVEEYEKIFHISVIKCGFFVDREYSFLGATPDGLLGSAGLLEVNCPLLSEKEPTLQQAATLQPNFFLKIENNHLKLKKNHNLFYQIQGQLHITERRFCDFFVYTVNGSHCERIFRDDSFWKTRMEKQLKNFYMKCMLPEIVDSRHERSMPLREAHESFETRKQNEYSTDMSGDHTYGKSC